MTGAAAIEEQDKSRILNRLCHAIVLSRDVTVSQIVDRLVLTLLVADETLAAAGARDLASALDVYFGVRLSERLLQEALDRLETTGKVIVNSATGTRVLARSARDDVGERIRESAELEREVKNEWISSLSADLKEPPKSEEIWRCLQLFAARAFLRHGAETALLLSPQVPVKQPFEKSIAALLAQATEEASQSLDREVAQTEVRRFFETATPKRARYLAQLMDGAFTLFSLSVDEATGKYLRSQLRPLALFLDTNFIFGVLGLNDQADAQLAQELVELIRREGFPFTLYYHQETLREIERTLFAIGERRGCPLVRGI